MIIQASVVVVAYIATCTVCLDQIPEKYHKVLWVLPWYALMTFGCYTLMRVGIDLMSFNDYPEEIKVLEGDIKKARHNLELKGFRT